MVAFDMAGDAVISVDGDRWRGGGTPRVSHAGGRALLAVAGLCLALLGCGGLAVIDGQDSTGATGSGSGGSSSTTTPTGVGLGGTGGVGGEPGWAGAGPGPCTTCRGWFEDCAGPSLCAAPSSSCAGSEQQQSLALVQCICAGCMELCKGSCVMFSSGDPDCLACQTDSLLSGCWYEYLTCIDTWPE